MSFGRADAISEGYDSLLPDFFLILLRQAPDILGGDGLEFRETCQEECGKDLPFLVDVIIPVLKERRNPDSVIVGGHRIIPVRIEPGQEELLVLLQVHEILFERLDDCTVILEGIRIEFFEAHTILRPDLPVLCNLADIPESESWQDTVPDFFPFCLIHRIPSLSCALPW